MTNKKFKILFTQLPVKNFISTILLSFISMYSNKKLYSKA
ncbi:hypothetical protein J624_0553 [Acinetobacter baumannii 1062314]|nr:hypothetical protein J624_0553 [Acinetobacter baumannii 1062314]